MEGERVREKGVGEEWGKIGGQGWGEGEWIDMGSGKYIPQLRESFWWFTRDLSIKGIPGPRRDPQIVLWTAERVSKPALAHNHTDEYFAYHHRTFIRRWMAVETETHIGALD